MKRIYLVIRQRVSHPHMSNVDEWGLCLISDQVISESELPSAPELTEGTMFHFCRLSALNGLHVERTLAVYNGVWQLVNIIMDARNHPAVERLCREALAGSLPWDELDRFQADTPIMVG